MSYAMWCTRSYGTPPTMVMNVMSSVCLLLKEPTDWTSIKHIIVDPVAFLKRLTSLDKDNVSDKVCHGYLPKYSPELRPAPLIRLLDWF